MVSVLKQTKLANGLKDEPIYQKVMGKLTASITDISSVLDDVKKRFEEIKSKALVTEISFIKPSVLAETLGNDNEKLMNDVQAVKTGLSDINHELDLLKMEIQQHEKELSVLKEIKEELQKLA